MQTILSNSKSIVLAILSCILLMVWDGDNSDVGRFYYLGNGVTSYDSVWETMRQDFKLDHRTNSFRVQREIHRFMNDQSRLYQILQQAGPYMYYILKQTKARGLPGELALIPAIESEFNPNDHSSAGATGLWQLMPETARDFGIKVSSGYDGRRNVIDSTKAALAYFNDLGNNFDGNWDLAIAAYNCGPGCVTSAEHRTGSQSFWNLPLPRDTKYYVPRLLAIAAIIKNPQKYGIELPPIKSKPYFTEVQMKKPVSLTQVAKKSGVNIKTLKALNPDYKHTIPVKNGTARLLLPINKTPVINKPSSHA